jgi:DNA repair protein RadC
VDELEPYFREAMEFKELCYCIYLNNNNEVLGIYKVSEGGTRGTVADIKIILGTGLKILAQSLIIAHNHPSGNMKPSRMDHRITKEIATGAKYFDMEVVDHIILTKNGYTSMANEGILEL